jgi:hypothetical protein
VDKVAVIKGIRRLEEERQPTFEEEAVYDTLPVNFGGTDGVDCGSFGSSYTLPINVETTACEHLGSTC